jgi:hypothetical protein
MTSSVDVPEDVPPSVGSYDNGDNYGSDSDNSDSSNGGSE